MTRSRNESMDVRKILAEEFSLKQSQIQNALALFDDGATVPFIARYRKEQTGSLNEIQLRDIEHRYAYFNELMERKETVLSTIADQDKLTPALKKKIDETLSKTELEDIYLPYKPKRATRATKARDAGLEPLARRLEDLEESSVDLLLLAEPFVNNEKGYDTVQSALKGAGDILAEELAERAEVRKWLREKAWEIGVLSSTVTKEFEKQKTKFEMYYDFSEKVSTLPSHRVLAMLRGEKEKVLRVALVLDEAVAVGYCEKQLIRHPGSSAVPFLKETAADAWRRLLSMATETEIRKMLRERAEIEALGVFSSNLENLLLAPPAGQKPVLAIDPGFRTGCKVVALDGTGKFLEFTTINPHEPQKKVAAAQKTILRLVDVHAIELIAVGNGTAGRETDRFIRDLLKNMEKKPVPRCIMVNESGASVYSASDVAIAEFPDFDLTVRGAISIGRRLQDPLSELVKIDPKSIGVGQYQHDVNQVRLKKHLEEVVESCVNRVGVNINQASEELLKYVSGLNRPAARGIVRYRNEHGIFSSREQLKKVAGFGDKKYEQAAGFLRIPGAKNPLDNSSVHPERYGLVEKMAQSLKAEVRGFIGSAQMVRKIDKNSFVSESVGLPTIEDILLELEKPGRDPRASFEYARFNDDITEIADLKEGMVLEGTVTNVTNFGAFVDCGVHQDGLVHVSELANRFVDDPKKVINVGQVVRVKVLSADPDRKRIALSIKALLEPSKGSTNHGGKKKENRSSRSGDKKPAQGKLKTFKPKFSVKQLMR